MKEKGRFPSRSIKKLRERFLIRLRSARLRAIVGAVTERPAADYLPFRERDIPCDGWCERRAVFTASGREKDRIDEVVTCLTKYCARSE